MKNQAIYSHVGESIPYTPDGADVDAGQVVVLGDNLVCVSNADIADGEGGSLVTHGVFDVVKDDSDISGPTAAYWDADGDPVDGEAGTGAFTSDPTKGPFAGWFLDEAGPAVGTARMYLNSRDAAVAVERSALVQDDLQPYGISLIDMRAPGTGAILGSSAGTPAGAFGLAVGTHGTDSPILEGESANNSSESNSARFNFVLPPEYVAGESIMLRVRARITGDVEVAQTIDATCHAADGDGGAGSDLVSTAAQQLSDSFEDHDFTITPTGLEPGDLLDIVVTGAANDTGGSAGENVEVGAVAVLLDIKG